MAEDTVIIYLLEAEKKRKEIQQQLKNNVSLWSGLACLLVLSGKANKKLKGRNDGWVFP